MGELVNLESDHFKSEKYNEIMGCRLEHATVDKIAGDLCWKLWIPEGLVPEALRLCYEHL